MDNCSNPISALNLCTSRDSKTNDYVQQELPLFSDDEGVMYRNCDTKERMLHTFCYISEKAAEALFY